MKLPQFAQSGQQTFESWMFQTVTSNTVLLDSYTSLSVVCIADEGRQAAKFTFRFWWDGQPASRRIEIEARFYLTPCFLETNHQGALPTCGTRSTFHNPARAAVATPNWRENHG